MTTHQAAWGGHDNWRRAYRSIELPDTFACDLNFDTPGMRVTMLFVETAGESFAQDIRLMS